jgi:dihydroxyacetone kinase
MTPIPLLPAPQQAKASTTASAGGVLSAADRTQVEQAIGLAAQRILAAAPDLTQYDSVAGDGDCGATLSRGVTQLVDDVKQHGLGSTAEEAALRTARSLRTMGGSSGALYNILLTGTAAGMRSARAADAKASEAVIAARGFEAGIAAVRKYGGAELGYRTMIDALVPASKQLNEELARGKSLNVALAAAVFASPRVGRLLSPILPTTRVFCVCDCRLWPPRKAHKPRR